ncbi:MAG: DNA gyrase subunit A, partial [Rickettsiales bacterium]|nr:DNA gyrase subunit A [Rickettsiales bacterium]
GILKQELLEIKEEFATPRRTEISDAEFEQDVEDLIQKEDMVVTVTMGGYIKRVPLSTYRAQRRGGKGRSGMAVRDEDITTQVFISNTHTPMLFFSTAGKVYKLKVYRLPLGNPQSRGRSLMNIFPLIEGETINMVMALPEDETAWETMDIMFATTSGNVRRNKLTDFQNIQSNGKIAMKLEESDALVGVSVCSEDQHVLLASAQGQALRCPVTAVRVFKGRNSVGVRGMKLAKGDTVISMSIISGFGEGEDTETRTNYLRIPVEQRRAVACAEEDEALQEALSTIEDSPLDKETITAWAKNEQFLLAITENGYGKRTSAYEYRITNRGGKGVTNILTSERNGLVVSTFPVESGDQIMLITNRGKLIRTPIRDVRITSRNTQGVKLFTVNDDEKVVSSAYIAESEAEDEQDENLEKSANSEAENNAESSEDTPDDSEE